MRSNLLKLTITVLFAVVFFVYLSQGRTATAEQAGPPVSRTGAPGELTCAVSQCHNQFALNSGTGTLTLTGLPAEYVPSQEIDLTVTLTQANRATYGFELTVIDDQGRRAGDLIVTDPSRTQRRSGTVGANLREYLEHNLSGTAPNGANQGSWNFRWRAPAQSVGRVTFYVAGNAGNGNGQPSGDFIYTINRSIQPAAAVPNVTSVSAASFAAGSLAPDAIAAAFGTGLSQNVATAPAGQPLPTELAGTQVVVRDAAGNDRNAQLFFVAPTQINFAVPTDTAPGQATVTVRRSGTNVAQGTITVERVAPGIFTANTGGTGVAAAVVIRVKANGEQTAEAVARINAAGQIESIPIDLGPEGEQVILVLFGTGFRNAALANVMTTIGGELANTQFVGATPGFVGLDQANILIPRTLAGRGNVDIVFKANDKTANTVTINLK